MEDTNEKFARGMRAMALGTFLAGTLIFIAYYFIGGKVLLVGYGFMVVAFMVNAPVFLVGLSNAIKSRERKEFLSAGIMLLNIPAMLFYVWFAFLLLDTARITFTNATKAEITNVRLSGCEELAMDDLQPGESETVWINIPFDCSVNLSYVINGEAESASVEGYLTPGLGGEKAYNIGGYNDPAARLR